jgi:hypothetical protein
MKTKQFLAIVALLVTSLVTSRATNTTITAWDFDGYTIGVQNNNPVPSTGAGDAFSLGMTNSYGGTSLPECDIILTPGASTGGSSDAWRIRGGSTFASAGTPDGWSSSSGIGTQGAQFNVNTMGYTNIQLKFDYYITGSGTAKIQVEYTTDGLTWVNDSNLVYSATPTYIHTNSTSANTVMGAYIFVTGGSAWYNGITVGLPAAANNNSKFGVRIVNASTGADDVTTTGGANPAGNIRLDNVIVSGLPEQLNNLTVWDFDSGYSSSIVINNPMPSYGIGFATSLGMSNNYTADTGGYSLPSCDVTGTPGASTGPNSSAWRVRGGGGTLSTAGNPNSGWSTEAPIGTQGAEFDVSTVSYSEIALTFDLYYTAAAPAQTEVEYTSDGVDWFNCTNVVLVAGEAAVLETNSTDPNTVTGVYFSQNNNGIAVFLTNISAYFPASCAGNPNFGVRIVNATTGEDMLNSSGLPYNDNSGNWRFDNIAISGAAGYVGGSSAALTPPLLSTATGVTVDSNSFSITFPPGNSSWVASITNIVAGSTNLFNAALGYDVGVTFGATNITFSMSSLAVFQTAGNVSITIGATNYSPTSVNQPIGPGAPEAFAFSSPLQAPVGNGGTFVSQPALSIVDQYGNAVTNLSGTVTATAAGGNWGFGTNSGTVVLLADGVGAFTNLCATNPAAVTGAYISFALTGAGLGTFAGASTNSVAFNLLPPPTAFTAGNIVVEQQDLVTKNSTFSMLELNPTNSSQSAPVNIFAVPATGPNALRQSSSGSCGRLALSDDHTLLCFSAGLCGDSTVADETTENGRGAATFNFLGLYTFQTSYQGYGGATADQARSATTVDDMIFFMGDKGGVYLNNETTNNAYIGYTVANGANVRSLKSFGGVVYALQQSGGSDPTATVLDVVPAIGSGSQALFPFEGFPIEPEVLDFYLYRSGNNGASYDVCYYIDGTNSTSGAIFKYYFTGSTDPNTGQPIWAPAGFWNTPNGGDGLCLSTNANGTVDLYYTTGSGGTAGNSVIHVVDNSAWNQPINLISSNTLYTVSAASSLRGISLAPVATNSLVAVAPILPIQITAGSSVFTGPAGSGSASFSLSFTNVTGVAASLNVYGTTNLTVPFSNWVNLGQPIEVTPGKYVFTNTAASNNVFFYTVNTNN